MGQQNLFKGRDKRKKGWFWMDNDYLNGYARYFGAIGTAIYVSLCRHADNDTQQCFPAIKLMAEELGISENTVKKYIKLFEKHQVVSVKREKNLITKRQENNVYTLLDKDNWVKPEATVACGSRRQLLTEPEATVDESRRQPLPHKETKVKETHIKETHFISKASFADNKINPLISQFQHLNPSYERIFSDKTQRKALERLTRKFGSGKVAKMIEYCVIIKDRQYAPVISTPLQLEKKLGDLVIFFRRESANRKFFVKI